MRPRPSDALTPRYRIEPASPLWPAPLCDLAHPPDRLDVAGHLPGWEQAVAIVGTRKPSVPAAQLARRLAYDLARAGRVVISGGAEGIDSEAHRGALDAVGVTVAVLGTPLAKPYPVANTELFSAIMERGSVMSEVLEDASMYPSRFLERNRLIAALASVVIVVQAPFGSGALSTAAEARTLGRPVLVVPYAPWEERGAGGVALLAAGAGVCRDCGDVLSLAAASPGAVARPTHKKNPRRPGKVQEIQGLDDDEQAVYGALTGPRAADELCEATSLSAPRVQRAILMLLPSRAIQEVGSGRYARCQDR
ncbi:MAG TPA: DNA-processing protein DprA [Polyangiales bacterium]